MVLRQSCGGSSAGTGISSVTISGCLGGSGIPASPLYIRIDPTGLIGCGSAGIKLLNAPSGGGGGAGTPASPLTSIQFNNGGSFGGSANLTYNGTGVTITGVVTSGIPSLVVSQTWFGPASTNYSGVIFNYIDPSSALSSSKMLDLQINGTSQFYVSKNGTTTSSYFVTANASSAGFYARSNTSPQFSLGASDDVVLTRDAANTLALRNGSGVPQALRIYNSYTGTNDEYVTLRFSGNIAQLSTINNGGLGRSLTIGTSGVPRITLAPSGAITFNQAYTFPTDLGTSGQVLYNNGGGVIKWGNVSGVAGGGAGSSGVTSLSLSLTGGGTHADPTTAVNLVYNNSSGTNTIDFRPLIYFNFGQAGTLSAESAIVDQPRFIVPEGFQIEICKAYLTIGSPGDDVTTVQLQKYTPTTDCTEPSTDGTPFSKDISGGCTWVEWVEVEGMTLSSLAQLNFRVLTPGTNAMNLVAHLWARVTVCYAP